MNLEYMDLDHEYSMYKPEEIPVGWEPLDIHLRLPSRMIRDGNSKRHLYKGTQEDFIDDYGDLFLERQGTLRPAIESEELVIYVLGHEPWENSYFMAGENTPFPIEIGEELIDEGKTLDLESTEYHEWFEENPPSPDTHVTKQLGEGDMLLIQNGNRGQPRTYWYLEDPPVYLKLGSSIPALVRSIIADKLDPDELYQDLLTGSA